MVHLGLQKYLMSVDSRQYSKQTPRTNPMPFAHKGPVHYVLKSSCILWALTMLQTNRQPLPWYFIWLYMQGKWILNCELLFQNAQHKATEFNWDVLVGCCRERSHRMKRLNKSHGQLHGHWIMKRPGSWNFAAASRFNGCIKPAATQLQVILPQNSSENKINLDQNPII